MPELLPILVPVDDRGDMRAVDFAIHMAGILGTGVRVLSVVHDRAAARERSMDLGNLLRGRQAAPVDVHVVAHPEIDAAIVDASASASTVCMTTAATMRPHEGHFGSVAESVVRSLQRPVVLLGPKADGPFAEAGSRLVLPVDGSFAGEYVVDCAIRFAEALDAEIWVVTVVSADQQRRAAAATGPDYGALESGYVRRVAREIVENSGRPAQFEVLHGRDPATAILDFAHGDGLIAMSTHGRTGLARIFAGSVTSHVVAGSHQPVMVVRPPDHVLDEG